MTKEERNKLMDRWNTRTMPWFYCLPEEKQEEIRLQDKAIRECDRKARAWDILSGWVSEASIQRGG